VLAALAGCGDPDAPKRVTVYEVKGQVLTAQGKPLSSGRIYFVPVKGSTTPAQGTIAADGTFTLNSGQSGAGAAPGEYKVRIEPLEETLPVAGRGKSRAAVKRFPFPMKYNDEDTSGLVVTVQPQPNTLEPFRLK
jgi:hypothetical protein